MTSRIMSKYDNCPYLIFIVCLFCFVLSQFIQFLYLLLYYLFNYYLRKKPFIILNQ